MSCSLWCGSALPQPRWVGVKHRPGQPQTLEGRMSLPAGTPAALGCMAGAIWEEVVLGGGDPRWLRATCAPQTTIISRSWLCEWKHCVCVSRLLCSWSWLELSRVAEPVEVHGAQLANVMHSDGKSSFNDEAVCCVSLCQPLF